MIKTARLENGITVVSEERPQSGKVSMQIYIKSGSMHEQPQERGLTFLMQEACNGGTATRSREKLAEEVESKGGSLETVGNKETTYFGVQSLTRHAKEAFEILSDMVRRPAFKAEEVEKTKAQIVLWISQQGQSPADRASIKFAETVFSGQMIGLDSMGTKELVASFTPAQVKQKHAEMLAHPENIVVSFAGDIAAAEAEKLVRSYFGDLAPAATPSLTPKIVFTDGDFREATENEQLNLIFGFEAPSLQDPDKYAVALFNDLLSGGMSAPLFQEIREERGLVYSVHSSYSPNESTGLFTITAGAGRGNAGELMSAAINLLGRIAKEGFDQEAMDQARERMIRNREAARETAKSAAASNASRILNYGHIQSAEEYEEQLKKVTLDDIRRVCANMLKDGKYAFSGVGPQDTMPTQQQIREMIGSQLKGVVIPSPVPVKRSIQPQFSKAAKQVRGHAEPKISVLANGMKVLTVERPGLLSCGAWVGAGSDHETPDLNGATHMNEHLMFKGTPSYGPGEIDRIVEGELGAQLNAYTTRDRTVYYYYNLKPELAALEKVTHICGEMVFKATLDHEEFDGKVTRKADGTASKAKGERDVVIEEINRANDNVNRQGWDLLSALSYPDQPHGRSVLGTEATLRAMTVEKLKAYRDEFYTPNNVTFAAAGPIKHEDFVKIVESNFGALPSNTFPPLPVPAYKGGTSSKEYKSAKVCNVVLGSEGVSMADPDSAAYEVLGAILTTGASSRLSKEIVMNQQLSAGVGAGLLNYSNAGQFYIAASLPAENIKPYIRTVYQEIRKLVDNLTTSELDKVKAVMEMDLISSMETNRAACDAYATNVMAQGKLVTPADIAASIQKLTVEDIKRVAAKVLASNPTAAIVVPPGTDPRYLPAHDEVLAARDGKGVKKPSAEPKKPGF